MARRRSKRRSSKADGVLGALVLLIVAGVFVYNIVAVYYPAILTVLGVSAIIWLGIKWIGWHKARVAKRTTPLKLWPDESRSSTPPPLPPTVARSQPPPPPVSQASRPASARTSEPRAPRVSATAISRENPDVASEDEPDGMFAPGVRIRPIVDAPKSGRMQTAKPSRNGRWIRPGEPVTIAGATIAGGMFYLGAPPSASSQFDNEPCFVDPNLNVAKNRSAKNDPPTYYPSYSRITPSQRRGFLDWMASGRCDPDENLSLVFLFFYGLERRLFKEGVVADAPRLIAEVERLLGIYGRHGAFTQYAKHFLAFARAYSPEPSAPSLDLDLANIPREMPLEARICLGRKLAGGGALQADDALVWAVSSPFSWRRRWPNQERDVFEHYWQIRFAARFPNGMAVRRPSEGIRDVYEPSSRSFKVQLKGGFENLPDPAGDSSTPITLAALVDECWGDGGSYANSAARSRDTQSALSASLLLPVGVWIKRNSRLLDTLANHLANAETSALVLPVIDIFEAADMSFSFAPKTMLAVLRKVSEGLWSVGVGLEPDGNYADAEVSVASKACLFRIPRPWNGAEYRAATDVGARLVVDIGILCAKTADNVEPEIRARIATIAAEGIGADELERVRLDAYAGIATPSVERQPRLLKNASQLPSELRALAARAAVAGATTKTRPPVQVIRHLEKIHKALGVPVEDLYGALHRAPAEDVVPVADLDPSEVAFEAVKRELESDAVDGSAKNFSIDKARLARAKTETDAVSKMLSEVFAEADPPKAGAAESLVAPVQRPALANDIFDGLDDRHGDLLRAILDAGSLKRTELETRAKSIKLFADAALDRINEWAFDRFDEPVVEDGDEVRVAPHLVERVVKMRKQS